MQRVKQTLILAALILGTYLVLPVAAQNFIWASVNGIPMGPGFTLTGPGKFTDGTPAVPSMTFVNDTDTGVFRVTTNVLGFTAGGGSTGVAGINSSGVVILDTLSLGWTNGASLTNAVDVSLGRGAADRLDLATGDSFNVVNGRIGYGAQAVTVDGATTFAITSGYVVLACTGAETINTITGGLTGMTLIIENTDTECTIADDDAPTAANAIDLTGTATTDVGAAKKIITLLYNGTDWVQISESDN